jgi:hypothetical protein
MRIGLCGFLLYSEPDLFDYRKATPPPIVDSAGSPGPLARPVRCSRLNTTAYGRGGSSRYPGDSPEELPA